jgi:phosphoglycolate phosphatase-like HAD superfamily hydrolase
MLDCICERLAFRKESVVKRSIKLAFFDFDGVIWDSEAEIYKGVCGVYRHYGREPPEFSVVWQSMSAPYAEWWRSQGFMASEGEIWNVFHEHADISRAKPKPEAQLLLSRLADYRIPAYIVSASNRWTIEDLLFRENLRGFFAGVFGDAEHAKDERIRETLAILELRPQQAMFVGDRPSDIRDGRNAGVVTVAYIANHPVEELLGRAAPDYLIRSLSDLLRIIERPAAASP